MRASYRIFLTLIFLILANFQVKGQTFSWVQTAGGKGDNDGNSIATDAAGNSYVTGQYSNTITFGSTTFNSLSTLHNYFVVKYSPNGSALWAQSATSPSSTGLSISLDKQGNCYVTGNYLESITFPGKTLTAGVQITGDFIVKYNSSGQLQWVNDIPGITAVESAITVDDAGNSYVTGKKGTAFPALEGFIAKFDISGKPLWQQTYPNLVGKDIKISVDNRIYVTGTMQATANLGTATLTSKGNSDIFITKMNAGGTVEWAKNIGSTNLDAAAALVLDAAGNCYVTGIFSGSLAGSGLQVPYKGQTDVLVTKFSPAGNLLWGLSGGSADYENIFDIAITPADEIYITGGFFGTFGFGSSTVTGAGKANIFLVKLSAAGQSNLICQPIVSDKIEGRSLANDDLGNLYLTGLVAGQTKVNNTTFTSGIHSFFITKIETKNWANCLIINPGTPPPPSQDPEEDISFMVPNIITPNGDGKNDVFKIGNLGTYNSLSLTVFNRYGKCVYANPAYANNWAGQNIAAGIYFYECEVSNGINSKKIKGWLEVLK